MSEADYHEIIWRNSSSEISPIPFLPFCLETGNSEEKRKWRKKKKEER